MEYAALKFVENDKGEIVFDGFPVVTLREEIGKGAFCKVYRADGFYKAHEINE